MTQSVSKGVKEKLRRAHMHRKDLKRRVERFNDSHAYSSVPEVHVETGQRLWRVDIQKRPPLIRWGALIGECLFNFRSALDHLAYDLAVAYSGFPLPPKVEEQSEFPIFWSKAPTKRDLDRRIRAIHPEARNLIEQMQPYGRKDRAALKYLDALHNFDKHRTLLLLAGVGVGLVEFGSGMYTFVNFSPLKDGDVLAIKPLSGNPEDQQNPNFLFGIAFAEETPGAAAPNVVTTLDWIGQHIEGGVIEPLLPYL